MNNNKNLTREELISIADKLYKHMNPETKRDTPSMVYEIVVDKWYPEFQKSEILLDFFSWCLMNK